MSGDVNPRDLQLRSLANLLLLESRLRQAPTAVELGYVLANDIRVIVPVDIAVVWADTDGRGRVLTVSALPEPTGGAPFTDFVGRLCRHLARDQAEARRVPPDSLPASWSGPWRELLHPEVIWIPLNTAHGQRLGGILLSRSVPWTDEEMRVVTRMAEAGAQSLLVLATKGRWKVTRHRRGAGWVLGLVSAMAAIGSLALPVRLSILAPAEVVAEKPLVIRAPLDGVVDKVLVKPNQTVAMGDPLFRLDDQALQTKLSMALQELEVTEAEFRQAQQGAGHDSQASARMPVLSVQISQKQSEVDYLRALLERIQVKAPAAGIVILPDVTHLEGKPVTLGERIMTLADPSVAVIEAWVPVQDTIQLDKGSRVDLFLNVEPETPRPARLSDMDYQAQTIAGDTVAYRTTAVFTGSETPPRIGMRGTVRVFGQEVYLFYYLFRRPWATIRPWLQW